MGQFRRPTTTDLISNGRYASAATNTVIETLGYTTKGDGGGGTWRKTGTTGLTASQSPAQTGGATLNDALGHQWSLVGDRTVERLGAIGDGAADDTLPLIAAQSDGIGILKRDTTYFITSRIQASANNTGLICEDGKATFLMSHADFNATTYTFSGGVFQPNAIGYEAQGRDNVSLEGVKFQLQSGSGIRTAIACAFRNCTNIHVDVEATGFKEMDLGAVTVDSCIGGECKVYAHTITADTDTLGSMQLTGLLVDENRVSSVYSKDIHFIDPRFEDITLGATALAQYGYQTDGMTLAGGATSGTGGCTVGVITAENVYEALDIQSANHVIEGLRLRDVNIGVKIIHAGKNNVIGEINAVNTGGPVVQFEGTSTASESADNNRVGPVRAVGVGDITGTGNASAAIFFAGISATLKSNNNVVEGVTVTDSPNMNNVVLDEAGLANRVLNTSGTGSVGVGNVNAANQDNDHVYISKLPRSACMATLSTDQTGVTNGTRIAWDQSTFDYQSELNTGNGQYVCNAPMTGRVSCMVRTPALDDGNYIEIRIFADGVAIASERQRNDSGGSIETALSVSSGLFRLEDLGKIVEAFIYTDQTSVIVSSTRSHMAIEEI